VCPPPDAKAKKSAEYVESKGVLAEKYDVLLHFAIAICVVWTAPCHRIPQGVRHWICWLRRASTGGLYFLLVVFCIMCMTSLQRLQVLHPFSSTDLWLLVLLHVGEGGWPCSGGNQSEIEPQDSIGSG